MALCQLCGMEQIEGCNGQGTLTDDGKDNACRFTACPNIREFERKLWNAKKVEHFSKWRDVRGVAVTKAGNTYVVCSVGEEFIVVFIDKPGELGVYERKDLQSLEIEGERVEQPEPEPEPDFEERMIDFFDGEMSDQEILARLDQTTAALDLVALTRKLMTKR